MCGRKIEKAEKKSDDYQHGRKTPKKADLPTCLGGLHQRLEKIKAKKAELKRHLDQGTIPRVIFGGKRNFYKRLEGNITNEEWKDLRSNQLYARGDKSKTYQCYVEIANPLGQPKGKHAPRLRMPVSVPEKYEKEIIDLVMGEPSRSECKRKAGHSISYIVEIQRKNGEIFINFSNQAYGAGRAFGSIHILKELDGLGV